MKRSLACPVLCGPEEACSEKSQARAQQPDAEAAIYDRDTQMERLSKLEKMLSSLGICLF